MPARAGAAVWRQPSGTLPALLRPPCPHAAL